MRRQSWSRGSVVTHWSETAHDDIIGVYTESLMVLKQAYIEDLIICRKASPSAASRTNPLPPRLTQHRLEAVMATVSVPIEEGHVIILHIPVGISTCS